MITRHAAEQQAHQCLLYHAGAFALTVAGLALAGNRATRAIAGGWGLGVLAHAVLLYGVPQTREKILMTTAAGMENREQRQRQKQPVRADAADQLSTASTLKKS